MALLVIYISSPCPSGVNIHRVFSLVDTGHHEKLLIEWYRYVVPTKMWIYWYGMVYYYSFVRLSCIRKRKNFILVAISWESDGLAIMVGVRIGDRPVGDSGSRIAKMCP